MTRDWQDLYRYWFSEIEDSHDWVKTRLPIWFFGSPEEDARIQADFVPWLSAITPEEEAAWKQTPRGFLTLILLFDQVPRNAFRGTPQSFAHDDRGLRLAEEFLARGLVRDLEGIEAFWVFLPFQHQETMAGQRMSVVGVNLQAERARQDHGIFFGIARDMARRHHAAIERFGRFPHRNAILGRESSGEEVQFLTDPKNHF